MRVYPRQGLNPNIPAITAPQPVRLPQDQLERGKQAYATNQVSTRNFRVWDLASRAGAVLGPIDSSRGNQDTFQIVVQVRMKGRSR